MSETDGIQEGTLHIWNSDQITRIARYPLAIFFCKKIEGLPTFYSPSAKVLMTLRNAANSSSVNVCANLAIFLIIRNS